MIERSQSFTQRDDGSALAEAAGTDSRPFDALYQQFHPRVYAYLRARSGSPEDAADLTQQVFLKALAGFPAFHGSADAFPAWLFRIARNLATDSFRRRRPTVPWHDVPEALHPRDSDGPEAFVLRQEAWERVRALLRDLSPEKRDLLALRFGAGLTCGEIAAIVGKREGAVRQQIARTLRTLKEQYHAE